MKKLLALLLVSIMALSLVACGGKGETTPTEETNATEETKLTEEQQLIIDTVNAKLATEEFANWQSLYKEFTGNEATAPKVSNVTHYQNSDFDGEAIDCYLVAISADVAYWMNEEAQQGIAENKFYIFVDSNAQAVYDSITTNAFNVDHDTTTEQGRATYLLWIHNNTLDGSYDGFYANDSETITELTEADLEVINNNLK